MKENSFEFSFVGFAKQWFFTIVNPDLLLMIILLWSLLYVTVACHTC